MAPTACRRTVSGTLSLRCKRCFSPFPHGTGSLSVSCECLALADGPAGFAQGFTCPALLRVPLCRARIRVRGSHPLRPPVPGAFRSPLRVQPRGPTTPEGPCDPTGLGCSPSARRYSGNHCCFLFLRVLRCFSSPRWPPAQGGMAGLRPAGFSHSDIRGSTAACASPRLFAACRVLHRLQEPRHPPYALRYLLAHRGSRPGASAGGTPAAPKGPRRASAPSLSLGRGGASRPRPAVFARAPGPQPRGSSPGGGAIRPRKEPFSLYSMSKISRRACAPVWRITDSNR